MYEKKLYRSPNNMLAGVCAGIGEFFGVDPTIIRLLWIFSLIAYGTGILLYLAAWVIIPLRQEYM